MSGSLDLDGIARRIRDSRLTEMGIVESAGMDMGYREELRIDRLEARRRLWEHDAPEMLERIRELEDQSRHPSG
jgi:hypothetical protein